MKTKLSFIGDTDIPYPEIAVEGTAEGMSYALAMLVVKIAEESGESVNEIFAMVDYVLNDMMNIK